MYKALILSLLFAMLAVPGSAETWTKEDEEAYRKSKNLTLFAIQSFGWKCDRITDSDYGTEKSHPVGILKVVCEDNLTYFVRISDGKKSTYCHKGVCKELK